MPGLRRLAGKRGARGGNANREREVGPSANGLFSNRKCFLISPAEKMRAGHGGLIAERKWIKRTETQRARQVFGRHLRPAKPNIYPAAKSPTPSIIRIERKRSFDQNSTFLDRTADPGKGEACRAQRDGIILAQFARASG